MISPLHQHDLQRCDNCDWVVGVDEAGRGPLAGPVTAGAVAVNLAILQSDACQEIARTANDSKQLDEATREAIYEKLIVLKASGQLMHAFAHANEAEIEQHNILGATALAMTRAVEALEAAMQLTFRQPKPEKDAGQAMLFEASPSTPGQQTTTILVDGKPMKRLQFRHEGIVKGDGKSLSIALASICAKVERDRHMLALDGKYPAYRFASNKGYPTPPHRAAILEHGPSPVHRRKFLEKILNKPMHEIVLPER